jgi:hypothetical protein
MLSFAPEAADGVRLPASGDAFSSDFSGILHKKPFAGRLILQAQCSTKGGATVHPPTITKGKE